RRVAQRISPGAERLRHASLPVRRPAGGPALGDRLLRGKQAAYPASWDARRVHSRRADCARARTLGPALHPARDALQRLPAQCTPLGAAAARAAARCAALRREGDGWGAWARPATLLYLPLRAVSVHVGALRLDKE